MVYSNSVAQFERKSMEKVNTGKASKNEWTMLPIRMLEWHGLYCKFINSFPCLFISSSAFNCCGENFQNILFHSLHFYNTYNGILLPKLFWPTVRKNCSNDREKLLKFSAFSLEFAKVGNLDFTTRVIFEFGRCRGYQLVSVSAQKLRLFFSFGIGLGPNQKN